MGKNKKYTWFITHNNQSVLKNGWPSFINAELVYELSEMELCVTYGAK